MAKTRDRRVRTTYEVEQDTTTTYSLARVSTPQITGNRGQWLTDFSEDAAGKHEHTELGALTREQLRALGVKIIDTLARN